MSPFPPFSRKKIPASSSSSTPTQFYISEPVRNSFVHVSSGFQPSPPPHSLHITTTMSSQTSDASTVVGHILPSPTFSSTTFSYASTTTSIRTLKLKLKNIFVKRKPQEKDEEEISIKKQGSFLRRCLRSSSKKSTSFWKQPSQPPPLITEESQDTSSIATTLTENKYSTDQEAIKLMQRIEQLFKEI